MSWPIRDRGTNAGQARTRTCSLTMLSLVWQTSCLACRARIMHASMLATEHRPVIGGHWFGIASYWLLLHANKRLAPLMTSLPNNTLELSRAIRQHDLHCIRIVGSASRLKIRFGITLRFQAALNRSSFTHVLGARRQSETRPQRRSTDTYGLGRPSVRAQTQKSMRMWSWYGSSRAPTAKTEFKAR